jgi:hypothetical protein
MRQSTAPLRVLALVGVVVALLVGRGVPLVAQDLPLVPLARVAAVLKHVLAAVNLTDDQQTTIAQIITAHKDAVETARSAGDVVTLRQEMRDAFLQIVQVLTPEQRETAKSAIKEILATRQSRSQ